MAQPPSDLIPIQGSSGGPPSDLIPVPSRTQPSAETQDEGIPRRGIKEKVMDVLAGGAKGGLMGAVAPEVLTLGGMAASAFPPIAPIGVPLMAAGQIARAARVPGMLMGAAGGAGGTAAGQLIPQPEKPLIDIPGGRITRRQAAEFAGEMAGPAIAGAPAAATRYLSAQIPAVGRAISERGGPSLLRGAAETELGTIRDKYGISRIFPFGRRSATERTAYDEVFAGLQKVDQQTQQKVQADLQAAQQRAEQIRAQYRDAATRAGQTSRTEANRLLAEGEQQAKKIEADALTSAQDKLGIARRAETAGRAAGARPGQALRQIGNPNVSDAQTGTNLQQRIVANLDAEQQALNTEYQSAKAQVTSLVSGKENAGQAVKDTKAYGDLMDYLNKQLVKGKYKEEARFAPVTEPTLRNVFENIRKAVADQKILIGVDEQGNPAYKTLPSSFEALDHVRRKLGEVFNGGEVEGYKGLLKEEAVKLYKMVRDAQVEYAGGKNGVLDNMLKNYSEGKDLLNALRIPAGKKIVATDKINPEYLTYDPSGLGAEFFKTKKKVQDLINLTKDAGFVESQASDYVARSLKDLNYKQAEKFAFNNKEWLDLFPGLQGKVNAYVDALKRSERIVPRTGELAKALRTEIKSLPAIAEKGAEKARKEAGVAAEKALAAGKKEAAAATKEGEKLAKEALGAAGEARRILGPGDPVTEIEKLITGGQTQKLLEAAPYIKQDKNLQKAFSDAVDMTLSRSNPSTIADDWERIIKPSLVNTGLISKAKADALSQRIRVVQMTLNPNAVVQTIRYIVKPFVIGELSTIQEPTNAP